MFVPRIRTILALAALVTLAGCSTRQKPLYQQWADQLQSMADSGSYRKADTSLLLGSQPSSCEGIEDPSSTIGVVVTRPDRSTGSRRGGAVAPTPREDSGPALALPFAGSRAPRIETVWPGTPAAAAGLRPGMGITAVDGVQVEAASEVLDAIRRAPVGSRISVATDAGVFPVVTSRVDEIEGNEQCYWDISAGTVAAGSSKAYVNAYAGAAGSESTAYQRFFRAACRFQDGALRSCSMNWQ